LEYKSGAISRVESRIGAYKNTIERCFSFQKPSSLEEYRSITQKMITSDNIKKGLYSKWMDIFKTGSLREFDETTRQKLGYTMHERVVNPRGCIELNRQEYFVSKRLNGERVSIYTLMDGTMKALDRMGNIYELTGIDHQYRQMGKYKAEKKSSFDYTLDEVKAEGKRLRKIVKPEHFLEGTPENLVMIKREGEPVEVTSPFETPGFKSADEAWYAVYKSTGFSRKHLSEDLAGKIDFLFHTTLERGREIPRDLFTEIIEIITDELREAQAL
jgi:hypothetical protein